MDKKEKELIDYYYNKLINQEFDEKDIFAFLILIRRFCTKYEDLNLIKEISDSIAHRVRNKGNVFNNSKNAKEAFDKNVYSRPNVDFEYDGFQIEEVYKQLNLLLSKLNYDKISMNIFEEIYLCVFSILQFSKYQNEKGYYGTLRIFIIKKEIALISYFSKDRPCICCGKLSDKYTNCDELLFSDIPITVIRKGKKLKILHDGKEL